VQRTRRAYLKMQQGNLPCEEACLEKVLGFPSIRRKWVHQRMED